MKRQGTYFWLGDWVCEILNPQPIQRGKYTFEDPKTGMLWHARRIADRLCQYVKNSGEVERLCPFCQGSGKFVPGEFVKDEIEGLPCWKCGGHIKTFSLGTGQQRFRIKSPRIMQAPHLSYEYYKHSELSHIQICIAAANLLEAHNLDTDMWLSVSEDLEPILHTE